jgi:ribosomal protein S25
MFPCKISQRFVKQWKVLAKIWKRIYQVRSRYFYLAFERLFSHIPFLRSFEHKKRKKNAYEETKKKKKKKKKKKRKTRDALHECSMLRTALKIIEKRKTLTNSVITTRKKMFWHLQQHIMKTFHCRYTSLDYIREEIT